ncbi:hypothetical protein Tco_1054849 [Tanacetum coccineum]|uniref:Uncharacterized protein n=1 Tax=Tanacetum coccineum TaxID=301880 RepID=A0ABQ5GXZ2_9ASTR
MKVGQSWVSSSSSSSSLSSKGSSSIIIISIINHVITCRAHHLLSPAIARHQEQIFTVCSYQSPPPDLSSGSEIGDDGGAQVQAIGQGMMGLLCLQGKSHRITYTMTSGYKPPSARVLSSSAPKRIALDVETQEKNSADTEVLLEEETLTKLIEDLGSGEKEISTVDVPVSTTSEEISTARHDVSTTAVALVYIRRSASKANDKGKAIMQEHELPKKLKKRSDPVVLKYHALQNRPYFVAKVRKNMVMYLKNQARYKQKDKEKGTEKKFGGTRKKTLARKRADEKKSEESSKRQKNEEAAAGYEQEKAELRLWLNVAQDDEESVNPEILSTKYPIVDWEHQLLGQMGGKDFKVYKLTRSDGSASYHGNIQAFLRRLDREDLSNLYKLVQERFLDHPLEGRDLLLWGDLRMIFNPNEKDDIYQYASGEEVPSDEGFAREDAKLAVRNRRRKYYGF